MQISSYEDLLSAAKQQKDPQRLLLVFASAELPGDATDAEKERFSRQQGGTLSPVMCVDKLPEELGDFASLVEESRQTEMSWDVVFVSSMSGRAGIAPHSHEAEQPLKKMVDSIKTGNVNRFLAFNRGGEILHFF